MSALDVIGLGVCTLDMSWRVDHFAAGEEIQRAQELHVGGGGPVATAIVAAARLGARTAMLDVLGDDWAAELIFDRLVREGVDTRDLRRAAGCTTAIASIWVRGGDGARTIAYVQGSTPALAAADLPAGAIESARLLHLNGRHMHASLEACRRARAAGVRISFDGGAHRYRPEMRALVAQSDLCIVAREFGQRYTGRQHIPEMGEALLAEGPSIVGITDGVRGSWIFTRGAPAIHQPAYAVQPLIDTTGCGDAYHGAFLVVWLEGRPLAEAAAFAAATAALNARALGGQPGLPGRADVEDFLRRAVPRNPTTP